MSSRVPASWASAFTLAELMIAIGILGVCVTMGATLFPVAIMEHEKSVGNTIGMLACQNNLNIARLVAAHDPLVDRLQVFLVTDPSDPHASCYPALTTAEPTGVGNSNDEWIEKPAESGAYYPRTLTGSAVFARQVTPGLNDYQVIVVTFRKQDERHRVVTKGPTDSLLVSVAVGGLSATVTCDDPFVLKEGGVIILASGEYAMVKSISGNVATLETPLPTGPDQPAFVIVEQDLAGDPVDRNPVMVVMSCRTTLAG